MNKDINTLINYFNANFAAYEDNGMINTYDNISLSKYFSFFINEIINDPNFCQSLPSLHNYIDYNKIINLSHQTTINGEYIIFDLDNNKQLKLEYLNNNYYALLSLHKDNNIITKEIKMNKNVIKTYIDYIKTNYKKIIIYNSMKNNTIIGNINGLLITSIKENELTKQKELSIIYTNYSLTYSIDLKISIILEKEPKIKLNNLSINKIQYCLSDEELNKFLNSIYINTLVLNKYIKEKHEESMKPSGNIIHIDEYRSRIKKYPTNK